MFNLTNIAYLRISLFLKQHPSGFGQDEGFSTKTVKTSFLKNYKNYT